jgi:PAS domain-containing protein
MSTDGRSPGSDATVLINADGTYADASGAALELLGVTIEELRAAGRGAFAVEPVSPEASAAIESAWDRSGAQDAVGHATVKRPDGATVRVRYLLTSQPDGRYLIAIQPIRESASQPSTLYTMGRVLSAWRAAEKRLEEVPPGSAEWIRTQAEVDAFREEYRRRFDERLKQSDSQISSR